MMYWNGHMTAAGWIIAIIWTLIILALIAGAIYWLASTLTARRTSDGAKDSAREILDRRLATGEITVEHYRALREALDDGTAPGRSETAAPRPASAPG